MAQPFRFDEKTLALRQAGALNARPEAVSDPLFGSHDFFDARDLVQVKYEMLRRVQADGQSVTEVANAFGFSRVSFYQARAAFREAGLPGLIPRRRGPRRAHKLNDAILDAVEEWRAANPILRTHDLVEQVEQRFGLRVHPRSIERALSRRAKKTARPVP